MNHLLKIMEYVENMPVINHKSAEWMNILPQKYVFTKCRINKYDFSTTCSRINTILQDISDKLFGLDFLQYRLLLLGFIKIVVLDVLDRLACQADWLD